MLLSKLLTKIVKQLDMMVVVDDYSRMSVSDRERKGFKCSCFRSGDQRPKTKDQPTNRQQDIWTDIQQ